jgi:hypothetical protein
MVHDLREPVLVRYAPTSPTANISILTEISNTIYFPSLCFMRMSVTHNRNHFACQLQRKLTDRLVARKAATLWSLQSLQTDRSSKHLQLI